MAEATDEIRSRIDIVELVGQRVALKRQGKDWKGLCPFHDDKNPSFQVSPSLGRYKCWSCGEAGDVFNWVMKTQNVEFPEALRILASHAGVALPTHGKGAEPSQRAVHNEAMDEALAFFRNQLGRNAAAKAYCERRGLDEEVLQLWELGFAPDEGSALATQLRKKNLPLAECRSLFLVDQDSSGGYFDRFRGRLMFPIRDERGTLVAFGGRLLGDGHPKYVNSGDTPLFHKSKVLYGMYRAKDHIAKQRTALLTEGYLDVIACHKAGLTTAVASLGTALTGDHARMLKRWCDGVVVLYDSDAAGQKAAERAIEVLEPEGLKVRIVLLPQGDDPDTLLKSGGAGALQAAVKAKLTPTAYRLELLKRRLGVDQEDFWIQAVEVLANCPTDREIEPHLMSLAPLHPEIRDVLVAQNSLRKDVMALRLSRERKQPPPPRRTAIKRETAISLKAGERILFHAFLGEPLRDHAFQFMAEPDLFETRQGAALAEALRKLFPKPPQGPPANWLHQLEATGDAQPLIDLALEEQAEPLSEALLKDTVEILRKKSEIRKLRSMKFGQLDDAAKAEWLDRQRKLKSGSD